MNIRLEGICKSYPTSGGAAMETLRNINLEIQTGEFVSLVGPSGCGKSTLLQILAGLEGPSSGRIFLDDVQTEPRCGDFAFMPQKDLLLPWRRVLDNLALGPELAGVPRAEARARVHEELPRFGLAGFESYYPAALSGGMRQRAALLRTYLLDRPVWLLDEPFGALDALTRSRLQLWLAEISSEEQLTIILVTHDVDEAVLLSDRVFILSDRPAEIREVVHIEASRPRRLEMLSDPYLAGIRTQLLEVLLGEKEGAAR